MDVHVFEQMNEALVDGAVGGAGADVTPGIFVVVVVAEDGEDAVRGAGGGEELEEVFEQWEGFGVVVDEIAGDDDEVGVFLETTGENLGEVAGASDADVEVGEMEDFEAFERGVETGQRQRIAVELPAKRSDEAWPDQRGEQKFAGRREDAVERTRKEEEFLERAALEGTGELRVGFDAKTARHQETRC